ncbi:baseplate J/gp47 family protein [Flavobacterium sp. M31R6]|uniref:baseplate J/gp47 family protein n=1 Tax=Flavobacterium sp. M31R6 TaxID=2739062 RepID=UPI00156894D9|nr:baseplate J/gp47 family protein [Flavobacterium sp. M31R6]QKJ61847.1 baseplate J/gp47 family protein [Flavobacterium sp. M31R6]
MDNCSSNISIHQGMGTTQEERFLMALKPDYFLVDERKEVDFIAFAQKLAVHIKFYNDSNVEDGNWSNFFQWESTAILVQLYLWDVRKLQEQYKICKIEVKTSTVVADQKKILLSYFETINSQFLDFNRKINVLDSTLSAKETLQGTSPYFIQKIKDLNDKITASTNPVALISNSQFDKNVQQLYGLMHNWKQVAGENISNQLESYSNHKPHFTLYLSFLKLLGIAQSQLNEFTKRHLDFYYRDVLQIQPANARPDYVHLVLEPTPEKAVLVPKGRVFPAGKNSLGKNKFYTSTADQAINDGRLHSFLSHYKTITSLWNQSDFIKLNAQNKSFNVFSDSGTMVETGLLIASPLFFLSGGYRVIFLKINDETLDLSHYKFFITGEKKVIEINATYYYGNYIYLEILASEKKIIAHDPGIHGGVNIKTDYPVLKIVSLNGAKQIDITQLDIYIYVSGLKNFVLGTDTGLVDTSKTFKPFGDFPKNGNGFVIGCNEFFVKKNANLSLNINPYFSSGLDLQTEKLIDGLWSNTQTFNYQIENTNPIPEYQEKNTLPNASSVSGYAKIILNDTDFAGEKFLETFITQSKADSVTLPVAPTINEISLQYSVSDTYVNGASNNPIEVYHILPFGYKKDELYDSKFPHDGPVGGELYLGFEKVIPGNGLSLLIQLAEGTANPRQEPATVKWSYLNQNTWTPIDPHEMGDETNGLTQSGLVQLTIPEFDTSQTTILEKSLFWIKISADRTDAICHFIGVHTQALKAVLTDFEQNGNVFTENTPKETISKFHEPIDFIKKVTQPYASFSGKKKEDDVLLYQRSSERLRHKKRAITSWDYERLILDEFPEVHRVKCLNHYRYNATTISNVSAGYITLIPIAKSNNYQNPVSWKPLLSLGTMKKIQQYITKIASPHARISVKTPTLEKIEVKFKVKYHEIPGADTRLYASELIKIINTYLSPWAFENNEVVFANAIETSALIQLIDNQIFVDYITDFEVNQIILNDTNDSVKNIFYKVKEIIPMTDFTLFVPNESHFIEEINN